MKILAIPSTGIPEIWSDVKHLIEKSLEHSYGETTIDIIYKDLVNANNQLWLIVDEKYAVHGACVTKIVIYREGVKSVLFCFLGGDSMWEWMELLDDTVSNWAKSIGANSVELIGRKGWEKKLKNWHTAYYCMRKEV